MLLSLSGTVDHYTRYYINQSGGGEISPVYKVSFRVRGYMVLGLLFKGLFRFVKPLFYSGAKAVGKEALKQVQTC
jgi:hypothetical protein